MGDAERNEPAAASSAVAERLAALGYAEKRTIEGDCEEPARDEL